jgi:hypothetical protein
VLVGIVVHIAAGRPSAKLEGMAKTVAVELVGKVSVDMEGQHQLDHMLPSGKTDFDFGSDFLPRFLQNLVLEQLNPSFEDPLKDKMASLLAEYLSNSMEAHSASLDHFAAVRQSI